jgi:hypothetical protein
MSDKKLDDEMISALVRSVKYKIPDTVEESIDEAIDQAAAKKKRARQFKRPLLWYPVSVAAALAIIAVLLVFQSFVDKKPIEPADLISEIKTEFELKDKNIKILWVQKKDFNLKLKD